ncbi:MAG: hypothetical protein ACRD5L_09910 [Bryobacteraceae bacterium]
MKRFILYLFLGLLVAAAAYGGYRYFLRRAPSAGTEGPAPPLLSVMPPAPPYLIYADVDALRASSFLQGLIATVPAPATDPDYQRFIRETGFDYQRDLHRVGVAIFPASPQPIVVTAADGDFDQQKIQAYALRTGAQQQSDGRTVYVIPSDTAGRSVFLTFLNAHRIELISAATGTKPDFTGRSFASAPASANGGSGAADMSVRVNRVAGSALFAVARTDSWPENMNFGSIRADQVRNLMGSITWLTLAAVPEGGNLRVALEGECKTAGDARELSLTLDGLRFFARGMMAEPSTRRQFTPAGAATLEEILKLVDVSRDDTRIRLMVALTPKMLEGLAAAPPAAQHGTN